MHVHLNFELPEPGNHIQKNLNMHLTVHPLRFKYGIILNYMQSKATANWIVNTIACMPQFCTFDSAVIEARD